MSEFYDKNFVNYKMFNEKDYIKNAVWDVHYDNNFDLVYIFYAELQSKPYAT
jgi:hypothetical protein